MSHFTIRVLDASPELGLHPGDIVTFEPELAPPDSLLFVHRPLPANAGSLLPMLESGAAILLTPDSTVLDFAAAVGWARPRLVLEQCEQASQPIPIGPIDMEKALASLHDPQQRAPEEPVAFSLLFRTNPAGLKRLDRAKRAIRGKTERICHCCRQPFTSNIECAVTCGACKQAGQRRCFDCEEVFTAEHGKVKRCPGCLAKAQAEAEGKAARRARRRGGG